MRRSNLTTLLYLLLVFFSGAVAGGFVHRLYMMKTVSAATTGPQHNHAEFRKRYTEEMHTRLHLTDAQMAQLQTIMDATDQRLREMHRSVEQEHAQKIMAMLNDDQKAEYTKMREEREQRRRQHQQKGP